MAVNSTTTSAPGTQASVTDSGGESQGLLDFVIPRGDTGPMGPTGPAGADGKLEALAMVDGTDQDAGAGEALLFANAPLFAYGPFAHQAGQPSAQILRSGVYQVIFQAAVTHVECGKVPATLLLKMKLDGAAVEGAEAWHIFRDSREAASLAFSVPFQVTKAPGSVEVQVAQGSGVVTSRSLTLIRLGDLDQA